MLKLTRYDGEPVYVDHTKIVSIQISRRGNEGTLVVLEGDEVVVKESPQDVAFYCQFKQSYNISNPKIDTVNYKEYKVNDEDDVLEDFEAILSYAKRYLDSKIEEVESDESKKENLWPGLDYYKNIRDRIKNTYFDNLVSVTLNETVGE